MASPTADEILELFEELNYPSASKLRAGLLKKGFKARLKDVEELSRVKHQRNSLPKLPNTAARSLPLAQTIDGSVTLLILPRNRLGSSNTSFWSRTSFPGNCGQLPSKTSQ